MTVRLHRDRPVPLSATLGHQPRRGLRRLGVLAALGLGALGMGSLFSQSDSKLGQTLAASAVLPASQSATGWAGGGRWGRSRLGATAGVFQ